MLKINEKKDRTKVNKWTELDEMSRNDMLREVFGTNDELRKLYKEIDEPSINECSSTDDFERFYKNIERKFDEINRMSESEFMDAIQRETARIRKLY